MARQAVISGANKSLRIETYDVPPVPPNLVRIKVAYGGICHTDLHLREDNGVSFGVKLRDVYGEDKFNSMVMGHEVGGYVDDIGSESNADQLGLKKGDRVAVYPWMGCQSCGACGIEKPNLCSSEMPLLHFMGMGPNIKGGYGSHVIVPPKFLVKVPQNISLDVASILTCSGGTVLSALKKLEETVQFGVDTSQSGVAKLLIVGAGGLGLWAVKLAKVMFKGKVHVMVAEIDQKKIDLAKEYGADEGILWSRNNMDENIAAALKGGKIHGIIDLIGSTITLKTNSKILCRNGRMVVVGAQGGEVGVQISDIVVTGNAIVGSIVFTLAEMREVVDLVSKNNITYPNIRHFTLEAVNEALELLEKGQISGRAVLKYE